MAPFKLPQDYIEILGGFNSEKFIEFKGLFKSGFKDVRKYAERIVSLVELMQKGTPFPFPFPFAVADDFCVKKDQIYLASITAISPHNNFARDSSWG